MFSTHPIIIMCVRPCRLQEPASVRILAAALHHIERGIERRFLKPPLGECSACALGGCQGSGRAGFSSLRLQYQRNPGCLLPPAGEEDTRKEQKTKKNRKKDEDQASDGRGKKKDLCRTISLW